MATLINLNEFAVPVAALGRVLAPLETIVVEDEKIVRQAIATGVLHSDLEDLSEADKEALASIEQGAEKIAATWHREHGSDALAEAVGSGEPVEVPEANRGHDEAVFRQATPSPAEGHPEVAPNPILAPAATPLADDSLGVIK